ncbi:general substrate transporter [Saitoella complicata NRRL Y-17804]|nr:general substrate transporter [Saitoella complicata NRRL Y-17804]ODQ50196.1 general substrate transporter [Saitoella complicata NRRL Y-17804]
MPGGAVGGVSVVNYDYEQGKSSRAILIGLFAAFGGILFGYDTGTISGIIAMKPWLAQFGKATGNPADPYAITSSQQSGIVSILSAGTFFGALLAAVVADWIGRKLGIIVSCLVFAFGVALQTAASGIPLFLAGRFFAGFGVGLISTFVPMYQSEAAPKALRGAIVACYQLAITIGLLMAALANQGQHNKSGSSSYRVVIAIQFAWALILGGGMMFLPETPRFWIKKDRLEKAGNSLSRLRGLPATDPAIQAELAEIKANHDYEMSFGEGSWLDCFRGGMAKRTWTGIWLQGFQQLTGVNFIFYYGTTFFQQAHFQNAFLASLITTLVNVCSTFPGIYGVERFGRRKLLLIGAAGMAICEFIVAIVGTATGMGSTTANDVLIAFVCVYIFFFASTWGPIAWVVIGEIFPLKIRAKGIALSAASNWLWNWGIGYMTPYLVNPGPGNAGLEVKVFFLWGATCTMCFVFAYFFIYETKGLSLEQVDELYEKRTARTSEGFVPTVEFARHEDVGVGGGKDVAEMVEYAGKGAHGNVHEMV